MKLTIHQFSLQLNSCFSVSRESYSQQNCLIIELSDGGFSGYGEASEFMTDVYHSSISEMRKIFNQIKLEIESYDLENPEKMWHQFSKKLNSYPFAQCALDVAAYDLWSKKQNKKLTDCLNIDTRSLPQSSFSLGIDTIENSIKKIQTHSSWPSFKIKLGHSRDLEMVKALRKITPKPFKVDINCGWSLEEAILKITKLKHMNVSYIEEPLAASSWKNYSKLKKEVDIPISADESCVNMESLALCSESFDIVNIKLMKAGGITPALAMIKQAKKLGLQVMLGCMPESSIGISAIAQLAPLVDEVDLDSLAYLSNDPATGTLIKEGKITYSSHAGTGATLLEHGILC